MKEKKTKMMNLALKEIENMPFADSGEDFAAMLDESLSGKEVKEGTIIKGKIISIEKDLAIICTGLKTEGKVQLREFGANAANDLQVGDEVDVYLEKIENRYGEAVLSREKALQEKLWDKFAKAHKNKEHVEGTIFSKVKGGFTVDLNGTTAFLPGSQVDIRPIKDVTPLIGKQQPFIILKMDKVRGNIVVSRRAILEESKEEAKQEILSKIEEGAILEGTVKNITDYGVFVDLGEIDGLLHVTDMSWKRINHPSELVKVGDVIKVQVIKNNKDTKRVSLGIKQMEDNPWKGANKKYEAGSVHKGKVTNIPDYGLFVEIGPGIEGLVHISEVSWVKRNLTPSQIANVGDEVEVKVLEIDEDKQRLSLGMKQCTDSPWEKFAEKHPVGEIIEYPIKKITEHGLVVDLKDEIDGFIHLSDLSWDEKPQDVLQKYNKDDVIKAKILAIDPEKEKVTLGIKQMENDPFESSINNIKKGQDSTFAVTAVQKDGIEVEVAEGIKSFIKRAELSSDKIEQRPDRFAVGDRVDAKIISVDKKTRKVGVSIKAMELEHQKKAIKEFGSTDSGASLGDILGVALKKSADEGAKAKGADAAEDKKS